MKVFVINGAAGVGKTTFEHMIGLLAEDKDIHILSTIDFVKDIARGCGWDGTKDDKNRKFLSDLKDLLTEWNDVPFKRIRHQIETLSYFDNEAGLYKESIFFVDCREPEEIQKLCDYFNAKSVIVRRPEAEGAKASNHADAEVLNYKYDIEIWNDSTLGHLTELAEEFIEENLK